MKDFSDLKAIAWRLLHFSFDFLLCFYRCRFGIVSRNVRSKLTAFQHV